MSIPSTASASSEPNQTSVSTMIDGLQEPWALELEQIFAADGLLARQFDGYRLRTAQLTMAQAVAAAIQAAAQKAAGDELEIKKDASQRTAGAAQPSLSGASSAELSSTPDNTDAENADSTLLVEAGTGTGKTFAYLVPAIRWGGKVILSTATRHLQDQLFLRDIPALRAALAVPVSVAMLKGRANYLCHYYLRRTVQSGRLPSRQDAAQLQKIIHFAEITQSGDKSELAGVPENAPIWHQVTSTRENCLGQECEHYKDCFVMRARRAAQQADLVVVNHHLFFADIMLRDTGVAELLPAANTLIFDEAHQLPDIATVFFGTTVSTSQLLELARDALAEGLQHARDAVAWTELSAALEQAARDLRLIFAPHTTRLPLADLANDHPFYSTFKLLLEALAALTDALMTQAERAESLSQCWQRADQLQQTLTLFLSEASTPITSATPQSKKSQTTSAPASTNETAAALEQTVRWVEVFTHTVQLHITPLSIASIFAKQRAGSPRAWIFTSATLSVRGDFTHYAAQMGLDARRSLTLPSPFDYAQQALLYVPPNLPSPASPSFTEAVVKAACPALEAAQGRAFVLCTTLRAVEKIAELLRAISEERGWSFPLLVQGETSRTELLERFRRQGNAILIGSQSFWEGVDVRGDALSLVIIDKLPFAPPDDPVLAARLAALAKQGANPFMSYQLPHAILTLKQGAGRLLRAETDRGVLMICDPRLVDKPYGRRIWQSLPAFKRTREIDVVQAFLTENNEATLEPVDMDS